MPLYIVELRGTITRDIRHLECDADDEDEVRRITAYEMPTHKVWSIKAAKHLEGCPQKVTASEACICDELETDN